MTGIEPGATVGFIGLGRMDSPMATRLAAAGYLVQGYDVSEQAARIWSERVPALPGVRHLGNWTANAGPLHAAAPRRAAPRRP